MKKLINSTVAIGFSEIILLFVGLARNKYLAINIGPEGFGMYSMLNSFFALASAFAGTWIATGTTKYIAQFALNNNGEIKNKIFQYSFFVTLLLSALLAVTLGLYNEFFIKLFISDEIEKKYYFIFLASFCWMNLRQILLATLQGVSAVECVVKSRYYIALVEVISIFILVRYLGLAGFFLSIWLTSIVAVVIMSFFVINRCKFKLLSNEIIENEKQYFIDLLLFGGNNFLTTIINLGSVYLQRYFILVSLGVNSVGIFQAGISIMNYLSFLNKGSLFHLLPTMSREISDEVRSTKLNEYLLLISITSIPICVVSILYANDIIGILFSDKFQLLNYTLYQFIISQMVIMVSSAFQLTIVGMGKLSIHFLSVVVMHGTWVAVPAIYSKEYGVSAAILGMIAGAFFGGVIYYKSLCKIINFTLSKRVVLVTIVNAAFTCFFVNINEFGLTIKISSTLSYMLAIFLCQSAKDRSKIINYIKEKISKYAI